jgi:outer membrane lipoprotein-sorting protein
MGGQLTMSRQDWDAAKAVVMRAVAARGGLETLRAVKTVVATAATVLTTPNGPLRAETKTYIQYPGRFRVEATVPSGALIQACVDGEAWLQDPTGVRDAPPGMRDEFRQSVLRDVVNLLIAASDDKLMGRRVADEKGLGGRAQDVVELWSDELAPVRLYVDRETGQVARESYRAQGPLGPETTVEEFEDYRDVGGLSVPFRAVVRRDSAPLLARTITQVQVNVDLPPGIFIKPQ